MAGIELNQHQVVVVEGDEAEEEDPAAPVGSVIRR